MEFLEFLTSNLDLTVKLILDAALGRGKAARHWAEKVHESGGSSRIIAVDKDIPADNGRDVEETLGDYQKYVDIKEADIFTLDFLADDPEAEGEWKCWTLLETVHLLAGEDFASFPGLRS